MKRIILNGRARLVGDVRVGGSKNAALPIIFATLITRGISEITNLPDIGDVRVALDIISELGAKVSRLGDTTLIDTRSLSYTEPSPDLISKIRASTYLIGASLSRFGRVKISEFGGCNFANRPIDMHLDACRILGAELNGDLLVTRGLVGGNIIFSKASVGATVNAIILAAAAKGTTRICGFAREPHIDALVDFLTSAGADIRRTESTITIVGRELHGGKITVIGDMIEAGTYLTAGLLTGGRVSVHGCNLPEVQTFLPFITALGAGVTVENDAVTACLSERAEYISVTAAPYPAFPTDLQPIIAPLLAKNAGGEIIDTVWSTRFGYLKTLAAFGVTSEISGNRAHIFPSTSIHPATVTAPDLRGGMASLLLALCAEGESIINSAEIILRGYEKLQEKLYALGQSIIIEDEKEK